MFSTILQEEYGNDSLSIFIFVARKNPLFFNESLFFQKKSGTHTISCMRFFTAKRRPEGRRLLKKSFKRPFLF